MITAERLQALLRDTRISDSARLLVLWIDGREVDAEGWVEATFEDFRGVLWKYPADRTITDHIRMLTASGWVERKPGGRGHGDRFRLSPQFTAAYPEIYPAENCGLSDSPQSTAAYPDIDCEPLRAKSSVVVVVEDDVVGGDDGERAREGTAISTRAREVIESRAESFTGFRGALLDYLRARVPSRLQSGYVQTIATWIDGHDAGAFKLPTGSKLPANEIPGYLAAALNELLATDEGKMKRDPGDIGNLRTKLNILLKQGGGNGRNGNGQGHDADGSGGEGRGREATSSSRETSAGIHSNGAGHVHEE